MNIVLKLSKLCNLRCTYCYEYEHLSEPGRMPLDRLAFFFQSLESYWKHRVSRREIRFALHGGEPLLLPPEYLRQLIALQDRFLGREGIVFTNAVQTNLYKIPAGILELLGELKIRLGVSLDVHGGQRVDAAGGDAEARVKRNLRQLIDSGNAGRIGVGGISVLHAGNVDRAVDTFRFFAELGLDYRILPIFSMSEVPVRMRHLLLQPEQIVAGLQSVFRAQLSRRGPRIKVFPLEDYFEAAIRYRKGIPADAYDPADSEWALIVDTNGDAYTHSEAYNPDYLLGNVFHQPVSEIMQSATRQCLLELRAVRAKTCEACTFGQSCSRIPMIEALPSERTPDGVGGLRCSVAQPMIAWLTSLMSSIPAEMSLEDSSLAAV